jgi:hypothetical protein
MLKSRAPKASADQVPRMIVAGGCRKPAIGRCRREPEVADYFADNALNKSVRRALARRVLALTNNAAIVAKTHDNSQ